MTKLAKRGNVDTLIAKAAEHIRNAKSEATKRSYVTDWKTFVEWRRKELNGTDKLPIDPKEIVVWIEYLSSTGRALSTIDRSLATISQAHKFLGFDSPCSAPIVREVRKGIRRERGSRQKQAAPITIDILRRLIDRTDNNLLGSRDRAMLLIGWSGALRRSEIVSLNVDDLTFSPEGLAIVIRRSKTDQEGSGRTIGIPFARSDSLCAARSVRAWLDRAGIKVGPIFRSLAAARTADLFLVGSARLSAQSVSLIVKRLSKSAGLDPDSFSAHSLRAGMVTACASAGVAEHAIRSHTGHRSERVFRGYIREGSIWKTNPLIGLL